MSDAPNGLPVEALDGSVQIASDEGTVKPLDAAPGQNLTVRQKPYRSASSAAADARGAMLTGKQEHCEQI